jgi:uridine kinase
MPRSDVGFVAADVVIAAVARLAAAVRERPVWVGIDGFGAAGKSTLAARIAAAVERADVVHVDDFWGPSIPEWDWARFRREVYVPLVAGGSTRYQVWDWDLDRGGEWIELAGRRIVVVEGVSCTRAEAGVTWDLTVWVESPRPVRLERALARDGAAMMPRWLEDWMPSEEAYATREHPRERVDYLVSGIA